MFIKFNSNKIPICVDTGYTCGARTHAIIKD
nr:MAG TPA: hypothetical protein [Caudoviricetes sp.]